MMKRILMIKSLVSVIFLLFIAPALLVYGESNLTLVPEKRIDMGLGFGGETVKFHGILPQAGASLIMRVESENNSPLKLTRKGKVVFFWMSVKQFEISKVPFFYKIYCSGKLNDILNEDLRKELHIGYEALNENMNLELLKGKPSDNDHQVVFDGFLKMKEKVGLYEMKEDAIDINDDQSFTFSLNFSDRAVEGNYKIECLAIKDGVLLGKTEEKITVEKVGLAKWFTNMAQQHSVFYGIFSVVVAILVGLITGFIFKGKGGH